MMRTLRLKKEILAELTDEELGGLVGASYKTKYDCTESHQACLPEVSRTLQVACLQTRLGACIPTQGC